MEFHFQAGSGIAGTACAQGVIVGANDLIRTDDLLITNELLYQLSYIGHLKKVSVYENTFPGSIRICCILSLIAKVRLGLKKERVVVPFQSLQQKEGKQVTVRRIKCRDCGAWPRPENNHSARILKRIRVGTRCGRKGLDCGSGKAP